MHQVECLMVDQWLQEGAQCSDGSMWLLAKKLIPGVQAVACCSEGVAGKHGAILRSVQEIGKAAHARHTVAIRYQSKVPRIIQIGGDTVNLQLAFMNDGSKSPSPDFGKECATDKLRIPSESEHTCAEVMVPVAATSTGQEEFIKGKIRFFCSNNDGRWSPETTPIDYEVRLAPTQLALLPPIKK